MILTYALLALLAALQLADLYTTHVVLAQGGWERNPLLARLFGIFGHKAVLLTIKVGLMALLGYVAMNYQALDFWGYFTVTVPQFLAVCCLAYALVVANNRRQIRRQ